MLWPRPFVHYFKCNPNIWKTIPFYSSIILVESDLFISYLFIILFLFLTEKQKKQTEESKQKIPFRYFRVVHLTVISSRPSTVYCLLIGSRFFIKCIHLWLLFCCFHIQIVYRAQTIWNTIQSALNEVDATRNQK